MYLQKKVLVVDTGVLAQKGALYQLVTQTTSGIEDCVSLQKLML